MRLPWQKRKIEKIWFIGGKKYIMRFEGNVNPQFMNDFANEFRKFMKDNKKTIMYYGGPKIEITQINMRKN